MTDADHLKEIGRLRAALKEIRDIDVIEIALDPNWPQRVASQALSPKGHASD